MHYFCNYLLFFLFKYGFDYSHFNPDLSTISKRPCTQNDDCTVTPITYICILYKGYLYLSVQYVSSGRDNSKVGVNSEQVRAIL